MLTVKSPERSPERLTRKTILAPTGTSGFPGLSTASTVIVGRARTCPWRGPPPPGSRASVRMMSALRVSAASS